MEWIYSEDELEMIARAFWDKAGERRIFAFHGEMGAGKTTLIRALCEQKDIQTGVSSPTFSLINEYTYSENGTDKLLVHMDLYRLRDEDEARQAGVEDYFYSDAICLVEWPEKAPSLFPEETVAVFISLLPDGSRKLIISEN